jgi:cytochrome c oxidase subunit 2
VLHDFAVAQFRVKMDLVPGNVTYQWFTPTLPGTYEILCEELCGTGHFAMRGRVVIEDADKYQAWLKNQPTFAQTQARPTGTAAAGAANYAVCLACHGAKGEGNQQVNAPKLAGLNDWYIRRQIEDYQRQIRGTQPGDQFGVAMGPMANTITDEAVLANVLAYINTLPNDPAPITVTGDVEKGRVLFETCSTCHGDKGEGRWGTNAPRLAGMSDWYLVRQLQYFRSGARGRHPQDLYGDQMSMMSGLLNAENAIPDVIAYINTLADR